MKTPIYLIVTAFMLFFTSSANAQFAGEWEQTNGPYGGIIYEIATSGDNIYAGNLDGMYYSTNKGLDWTFVNFSDNLVGAIVIDEDRIFVGTERNGIYLSTNNGISWDSINTGLANKDIRSLAVIGNRLFAGTYKGLYYSTNNGANWIDGNNGLPLNIITSFAIKGDTIFTGVWSKGIYKSIDNGDNWTAVNEGLLNHSVSEIVIKGENIFAGSRDGIFLSTNSGNSWTAVNSGLANRDIVSMAVCGNNIYAGTSGSGLYLSTDNGDSWSEFSTDFKSHYINTLAVNKNNIFVGSSTSGIFQLINNGIGWEQIGPPINEINDIAYDKNMIVASSNYGSVHISTDNGEKWELINKGFTAIDNAYGVEIVDDHIIAGESGLSSFTTDKGKTWTPCIGFSNYGTVSKLKKAEDILYASFGDIYDGGQIFWSTNKGKNWYPGTAKSAADIAIKGNDIYIVNYDGVYKSTDRGAKWKILTDSTKSISGESIYINGNDIYVGSGRAYLYKSTNDGKDWYSITAGLPPEAVIMAITVYGKHIFAGLFGGGMYYSSNYGESWVEAGLQNLNIEKLMIKDNYLFACTYLRGIYRRELEPQILTIPLLNFPADKDTNISIQTTLEWNAVDTATAYNIQVSESEDFQTIKLKSNDVTETNYPLSGLEYGKTYYWRVKATAGELKSEWSEVWSFTVEPDPTSVEEDSTQFSVSITPIPSKDYFDLSIDSPANGTVEITISDASGSIIKSLNIEISSDKANAVRIKTDDMLTGTYFVTITTNDRKITEKISVVR